MVAFLETNECGATMANMYMELMGRGLSLAGVDRATDWAAPKKPQHKCLLMMALYERFIGAFLDVEKADRQAPPPKSVLPQRAANTAQPAVQAAAQGAPNPISQEIEEPEARLSQLRAPRIPQCTPEQSRLVGDRAPAQRCTCGVGTACGTGRVHAGVSGCGWGGIAGRDVECNVCGSDTAALRTTSTGGTVQRAATCPNTGPTTARPWRTTWTVFQVWNVWPLGRGICIAPPTTTMVATVAATL